MSADRIVGVCAFVLGVLMIWGSTRIDYPTLGVGDPGPQVLPMALGLSIAVLGAVLALRQPAPVQSEALAFDAFDTAALVPAESPLMRIAHGVNLVAYAVLFERLGFSLSTFIFLSIAISLLGERSLRGGLVAVIVSATVTLVVGTGLSMGAGIPLPGVLFG